MSASETHAYLCLFHFLLIINYILSMSYFNCFFILYRFIKLTLFITTKNYIQKNILTKKKKTVFILFNSIYRFSYIFIYPIVCIILFPTIKKSQPVHNKHRSITQISVVIASHIAFIG